MMRPEVLTIMGTRPQYVKCAVLRGAYKKAGLKEVLLDTGQHYDSNMSSNIFLQLGVSEPDIKLKLGGQSQCRTIGSMMIELEAQVEVLRPKAIVVLGDTNSTLAGGLVAKKMSLPLFHVEAGLRSYDKNMPEEQNRIAIDHLSDLLLCPTQRSVDNLKLENIKSGVHFTGDVMLDAVEKFQDKFKKPTSLPFSLKETDYALITLHRADALASKETLEKRINYIRNSSASIQKIFLMHPHTRKKILQFGINVADFTCLEPQGYLETQWLLSNALCLYTDSGGMQKEAFFHSVPVTVMRESTEWPEIFVSNTNKMWEPCFSEIKSDKIETDPFGSGSAAENVVQLIRDAL